MYSWSLLSSFIYSYIWYDKYTYVLFCNIIIRYIVYLVGWEVSLPVKNMPPPPRPFFKSNPVCCHCSYLLFICLLCWCCLLLCKLSPRGRLKCFFFGQYNDFDLIWLYLGTLSDFKNCVTDNLLWAELLYFGVLVKEITQQLFLNHFIEKLSNSSILGVKFHFWQILSFQTNFLAQMYQAQKCALWGGGWSKNVLKLTVQ